MADNHFCVVHGGRRSFRRRIQPLGAGGGDGWGWAASWHRPVLAGHPPLVPGLRVESVTVAVGTQELRVHRVVGAPFDAVVEQTGWATAAGESTLVPLSGWVGQDEARAPRGTAFTPYASVPRLTAPARGTALFAALAVLGGPPVPIEVVSASANHLEVRWPDSATTRVSFDRRAGISAVWHQT